VMFSRIMKCLKWWWALEIVIPDLRTHRQVDVRCSLSDGGCLILISADVYDDVAH
jgi:hypothetical protein